MSTKTSTDQNSYPVLPLRDIIVFPHMIVPLFVGREKSVNALEDVMETGRKIILTTQKDASEDDPKVKDIFDVGTVGNILQMLKLPDGTVKVLVEGGVRVSLENLKDNGDFFEAGIIESPDPKEFDEDTTALGKAVISQFEQYIKLNKKIPPEVLGTIRQLEDISKLADTVASHLVLSIKEKQELLELFDVRDRLEKIFSFMEGEISVLQVEKRIRNRVKQQMEKTQREYYLNEQMKAIQKELNEGEEGLDEIGEIENKLSKLKLPKEMKTKAEAEVKKLKQMSPMSAEATVVRNYLDWVVNLPWGKKSKLKNDLDLAQDTLDADHHGLEKVKERIIEYLAVQKRMNKIKGPILCLVGPPGVGKTSLGRSIAEATNREFVRMSLGGVRDESEIRGHRRTYIGSMPGKIIQGMKKAGKANPLFLLDEIDKMSHDWRGDPASALLEVLDPEQNTTFNDHYLEVDYDLSDVMFICTANSLNLPRPLLDRMEIIRLSGYTEDEKVVICEKHLIEKQIEANGLKEKEFSISEGALRDLIRYYTKEAGVRNLEREIANLARKAVTEILKDKKKKSVKVTKNNLEKYAGIKKYRFGEAEDEDMLGVVTGLAWTEVGGDLLSIESVSLPGKGKVTMTGKLGDVMKESIQAAEMLIKSRSKTFGVDPKQFEKTDVHVHVPAGATPKDGPSAGIAMVTSIISSLVGIPVSKTVAMTGEITLRGRVLPIGGLKEKLLAAHRGGIKKVLIPIDNAKDLIEIPENVKKDIDIVPVSFIDEVLEHALTEKITPFEESESDSIVAADEASKGGDSATDSQIHH
ncbi:MAG: endopeptidase La [Rickettsiales bacterium]|nr:endopeptidase La [Rickettsiales bacterium]